MALEEGMKAPAFSAETDGGGTVSLSDLHGKWVVLYFYPKDDTSGCTKEACSFNDNLAVLEKEGAVVIGVSPDSVSSHDKFKEKYSLNFNLISDPENKISSAYHAYGEKSMYGRKYMGIIRSTFLIDPDGLIRKAYPNVKVTGHAVQVMKDLKELKGR